MSLENLSYEHEEQLKAYLKFFRSKRNYQIQEVDACFADQIDALNDEMYTRQEAVQILQSVCTAVRSGVLTDLQQTTHMSMLVMRQMFEEAEASEIDMDLDMSIVEDHSLLSEASKIQVDAPTRRERKRKNVKLAGIRDEHQRMMQEFDSVKEENKRLGELRDEHERAIAEGKHKRKQLRRQVAELKRQIESMASRADSSGSASKAAVDDAEVGTREGKSGAAEGLTNVAGASPDDVKEMGQMRTKLRQISLENEQLRARLQEMRLERDRGQPASRPAAGSKEADSGRVNSSPGDLDALRAQLSEYKAIINSRNIDMEDERQRALERVMRTSQFKTMKKMLTDKNDLLEQLRAKLRRYEPEADEYDVDRVPRGK